MGLTRALAIEWAPRGVRVNEVAPGIVATPMVTDLAADGSLDLDDLAARVPLGRIVTPDDIAGVTLMLVSRAGEYIIGRRSSSTAASRAPGRGTRAAASRVEDPPPNASRITQH